MHKSFYKKIIFLQAIFLMGGFLFIQNAQAGYSDTDSSPDEDNKISASSLDLEVITSKSFSEIDLLPGENVSVENVVKNIGGIDFKYKIDLTVSENKNDVCDSLELEITNDSGQIYGGILTDAVSNVVELAVNDSDNLSFVVSLPDTASSSVELSECVFDINLTAWQKEFTDFSEGGWVDSEIIAGSLIKTGSWAVLEVPVQTGYNENDESDSSSYPMPHSPDLNELSCVDDVTNINGISVHWTDVSGGDINVKYQRQYKVSLSGGWSGNEIYTNPYTNYRTFGGSGGNEGIYGSRVRAWRDLDNDNEVDSDEKFSDWSNECYITFDKTAPVVEITAPNESAVVSGMLDINGTIEDSNPHHYWLVIQGNSQTYGPSVVNESNSITNELLYTLDTEKLTDGIYTIKLEARDVAGNKSSDSMHWIDIEVENSPVISNLNIFDTGLTPDSENVIKTITWDTNEKTTSNVVWDIVSHSLSTDPFVDYGYFSPDPVDLTVDNIFHSVDLTVTIDSEQTYYYRVISEDQSGNVVYSDEQSFILDTVPTTASAGQIVINEFLVNPEEDESKADVPDGEWIEIYNNGTDAIELDGWYFTDLADHRLTISSINAKDGITEIAGSDYIVVYDNMKGVTNFSLNNTGIETVSLYDSSDNLQDTYTYDVDIDFPLTGKVLENKTYARFPDGIGPWVDPKPTPGEENEFTKDELEYFQEIVLEECFEENKLIENEEQSLCSPIFVDYIGLIDGIDSVNLKDKFIKESDEEKEKENKQEEKTKELLNDFQINKVEIPNKSEQISVPVVNIDVFDEGVKESPEENIDDVVVEVDKGTDENNSDVTDDEKDAESDKISGEKSEKSEQKDSKTIEPEEDDENPVVDIQIVEENDISEKDEIDIENEDKEMDVQAPNSEDAEEDYEETQEK